MDDLKSPDNRSDHDFCEHFKEPTVNDVLFGRGTRISNFEGNIRFRKVVQDLVQDYFSTNDRGVKTELTKSVIATIKDRQGRFLRKVVSKHTSDDYYWEPVEDMTLIMEKIKQTFRDTAGTTRCSDKKNLSEPTVSQHGQFKSTLKKNHIKDAPQVISSKTMRLAHGTTIDGLKVASKSSASFGNPNKLLDTDKNNIIGVPKSSLQVRSEAISEMKNVVNPQQQNFKLFNRGTPLSATIPFVVQRQLEEELAIRVNQERQRLLMNHIKFQMALESAQQRLSSLLVIQHMQQNGFHNFVQQVGLKAWDPHVAAAMQYSQLNNPRSLQLTQDNNTSSNQTHNRQNILNSNLFINMPDMH